MSALDHLQVIHTYSPALTEGPTLNLFAGYLFLCMGSLNLLSVPQTRLKTCGDGAFKSVAPKLWNAPPAALQSADLVNSFERQLKTYLFSHAFG